MFNKHYVIRTSGGGGGYWEISNQAILSGLSWSITEECLEIATVEKNLNQSDLRE
jgi:hypothetical protein